MIMDNRVCYIGLLLSLGIVDCNVSRLLLSNDWKLLFILKLSNETSLNDLNPQPATDPQSSTPSHQMPNSLLSTIVRAEVLLVRDRHSMHIIAKYY